MNRINRAIRIYRENLLSLTGIALSLIMPIQYLPAQAAGPDTEPAAANDPMETEGLEPKLARILTNYYKKTFSGPDNWENLQSVIFKAILHLPQGKVRFTAHKKKPDLYKVVLHRPKGERFVMGYDGNEPWQLNSTDASRRPTAMPEAEAKNFIRDATIGGHLLNPLMKGKHIEVGGTIDVDGRNCFELEVTLPDGQRIRSAIDFVEYAERQQITINQVNGQEERNIYRDFRVIDGVRFPFASTMISNGEEVHRVEMLEIRLNAGLIKSMFQRSSEIHSFEPKPKQPKQETLIDPQTSSPSRVPFGGSRFGESVFKDPEAKQSENSREIIKAPR